MKGTEEAGVWEGLAGGWGGEQSFFEAGVRSCCDMSHALLRF